jgi:hypothetical protein
MAYVESVEGEKGILGHFKHGSHILWRDLNLAEIKHIKARAGCFDATGGMFELRSGSPTGSLLATLEVKPTGEGEFLEVPATLANATGLTDVCLVAHCKDPAGVLGLNWVEFQP